MEGNIVGLVIWLVCIWGCGAVFLGIGIYAGKSDKPMHFWSGTTVNPKAVKDIPGYNRAMKKLWLVYSAPFWISGVLYFINAIAAAVLLVIASTLGIAGLIWEYSKISKKYVNSNLNIENQSTKEMAKGSKAAKGTILISVIILAACVILLCTGDVTITANDENLQISATYWGKTTIAWDEIQAVSLEENFDSGSKTGGFNSAKLELGHYTNSQCGRYLVYRYRNCRSCILITTNQGYVAVNGKTAQATQIIYDEIKGNVDLNVNGIHCNKYWQVV